VRSSHAIVVADQLISSMLRSGATGLLVEPAGGEHAVVLEHGPVASEELRIASELAEHVIARLAILAELDVAAETGQIGRLRARAGSHDADLMVATQVGPAGLGVELRRIAPRAIVVEEAAPERIGPYRLLGELGRGGAGIVFAGEHEKIGKRVAIKVLHVDLARDPVVSARFLREARAAARVSHPGIVQICDFGTLPDGRAFLVMERIDGENLAQLVAEGPMDPARAAAIARRIALALDAAHDAGVVHRDLKPANVFVLPDDEVKIADFGAAKIVDGAYASHDTNQGMVFGTPYYMAPEHARGLPTDRRTDVYALGCVLYEMLTGFPPFEGDTVVDILTRQITEPPVPPSRIVAAVPASIEKVVLRAMAKKPEDRHATCADLAFELERPGGAAARGTWRRWLSS
jgi:serine/threonine-protein kinase